MRLRSSLVLLGLVALPSAAHANGRFPASNQVVVSPKDPSHLVLRTTFGILLSSDAGATWDWICEGAVGYTGTEDPALALTGDGTLLAATYEGLVTSSDFGCNWSVAAGPLAGGLFIDDVVRPDAPSSAFVLSNKYKESDDAGNSLFSSNVYGTTDDAKTWTQLGQALDDTLLLQTIEVAKSDPRRLYVSGSRGYLADEKGVMLVSTDLGATWTERAVPIDPTIEHSAFISAVDPTNPDRVYVRTKMLASAHDGGPPPASRLLVTDDGGKTFREALRLTSDIFGFALSPDGSKVWVGSQKDGLFMASSTDLTFARKSPIAIQCLNASSGTLYACSSEAGGFILGASSDDGASFKPLLHLWGVRGPLACSASSSAAQCVPAWPALKDSLGSPPSDAGPADDGGSSSGGSGGSPRKSGCSCVATPSESAGDAAFGALGALAVGLVARRARRRRRRG